MMLAIHLCSSWSPLIETFLNLSLRGNASVARQYLPANGTLLNWFRTAMHWSKSPNSVMVPDSKPGGGKRPFELITCKGKERLTLVAHFRFESDLLCAVHWCLSGLRIKYSITSKHCLDTFPSIPFWTDKTLRFHLWSIWKCELVVNLEWSEVKFCQYSFTEASPRAWTRRLRPLSTSIRRPSLHLVPGSQHKAQHKTKTKEHLEFILLTLPQWL